MLRVQDNPMSRWPPGRALNEDVGDWWVARVRPRNEKSLAWELAALDVHYYLPMFTRRTRRADNGKPRKSVVCLFPGYVPLVGYPQRREDVLRSSRVLKVIQVPDQDRFVRELESVRLALEAAETIELHPDLVVGRPVRIISGPMRGITGVITDGTRRNRLFLNVDFFRRAVVVGVHPDDVMLGDDTQTSLSIGS
jgi:transcription antitermination factor NusG